MHKIRVLLVDDDKILLNDIESMIDWEGHGFEIVGKALNGKKAWELCTKLAPQLVITDIRMPVMDGLELARKISKFSPECKVLFLTSFEDFDYAKRAFQYNVSNYFLKNDLSSESFIRELYAIKSKIADETRLRVHDNREVLKNIVYNNHPINSNTDKSLRQRSFHVLVNLKFPLSYYVIKTKTDTMFIDNLTFNQELFHDFTLSDQFILSDHSILLALKPNNKIACLDHILNRQVELIQQFLLYEKNIHADVLIDSKYINTAEYIQYFISFRDNESLFFNEGDKIINLGELNPLYPSPSSIDLRFYEVFLAFEANDSVRMFDGLESILTNIFTNLNRKNLISFATETYDFLNEYWSFQKNSDIFTVPINAYWAEDIANWIYLSFYDALEHKALKDSPQYSSAVTDAISFIEKHYTEKDLTIKRIAHAVCISEGRLSVVFKEESGVTINKYITDLRMKKAMHLLKYTNLKVYEIAEIIGYSSSQYFSQVFMAYTNLTPNEYRKNK